MQLDPDDFDFQLPSKRKVVSPEKRRLSAKEPLGPQKRLRQTYLNIERFPSPLEFKQWQVDTSFCSLWGIFRSYDTAAGRVTTYYCKHNKACPAVLRVESVDVPGENGTVITLQKNSLDHVHCNIQAANEFVKRGLPTDVKQAAAYCIDTHDYTPKAIDAYCVKTGISIAPVKEKQLSNFCHKYKKKKTVEPHRQHSCPPAPSRVLLTIIFQQ
jgi:hypothetical protein